VFEFLTISDYWQMPVRARNRRTGLFERRFSPTPASLAQNMQHPVENRFGKGRRFRAKLDDSG
jgi:hypothetical protein